MICPSNILVSGPTQSGKTHMVLDMIRHRNKVFSPAPQRIVYCYGEWQPAFNPFRSIVEFCEGLPDEWDFDPTKRNLLVLDDLMDKASASDRVSDMFTKVGHHKNVTVLLLVQNLFFQGKRARNLSLNSHYLILFKSPRDVAQVHYLARQMYPTDSKLLLDSYKLATSRERGYLLIDCRPDTSDQSRLRGCILPHESPEVIYIKQ